LAVIQESSEGNILNISYAEAVQRQEAERNKRQENVTAAEATARKFKELGIISFTFYYSGSGGDGCIDDFQWEPYTLDLTVNQLEELTPLKNLVYEVLPSGWKKDEGGAGNVVIDLITGTIILGHQWLEYVDSNETTDITLNLGE